MRTKYTYQILCTWKKCFRWKLTWMTNCLKIRVRWIDFVEVWCRERYSIKNFYHVKTYIRNSSHAVPHDRVFEKPEKFNNRLTRTHTSPRQINLAPLNFTMLDGARQNLPLLMTFFSVFRFILPALIGANRGRENIFFSEIIFILNFISHLCTPTGDEHWMFELKLYVYTWC